MSPLNIENCPKNAIFKPRHPPTVQCTWPAPMRRSVLEGRLDFHRKYMEILMEHTKKAAGIEMNLGNIGQNLDILEGRWQFWENLSINHDFEGVNMQLYTCWEYTWWEARGAVPTRCTYKHGWCLLTKGDILTDPHSNYVCVVCIYI